MKAMDLDVAYYVGTKVQYINHLVQSVAWSGDVTEAARHCTITLKNTLGGAQKALTIEQGRSIRLYKNNKEFFRGIVFSTSITENGDMTITLHDANHYLTKNTDSKVFKKMTASQIILAICKQYQIPFGFVQDTKYVIPKLILRNKTLYDMITIALTETRKKNKSLFMLGNEHGKLTLRERKTQLVQLIVQDGHNLLSATYTESIEELRNSIRLTGSSGEDAMGVSVSNARSIAKYGLMREKQHESEKTNAQLKPIANTLLGELNQVKMESTVEAIGDTSVRAGKSLKVYQKMTGITGGFYVVADNHTFEANGKHTMSLMLARTLDLRELEYEEPSEPAAASPTPSNNNSSGGGGSGNSGSAGGKRGAVVSKARSYVGKLRYAFGGTNIPGGSGDCSAFVQYVMRQAAGLSLGRDTRAQVGKGVKVSKASAQPGDLVFFQGTYRSGVSHVGIVTGGGKCVSLASSGCKEHSYVSGYWGNHFMQIRRVL